MRLPKPTKAHVAVLSVQRLTLLRHFRPLSCAFLLVQTGRKSVPIPTSLLHSKRLPRLPNRFSEASSQATTQRQLIVTTVDPCRYSKAARQRLTAAPGVSTALHERLFPSLGRNSSGSTVFLSQDQIEQLTGLKRPSRQCRWLGDHGYRFEVNTRGRPVVLLSAVEQKLQLSTRSPRQPNFEALSDG